MKRLGGGWGMEVVVGTGRGKNRYWQEGWRGERQFTLGLRSQASRSGVT